jgi:hypothetical protein
VSRYRNLAIQTWGDKRFTALSAPQPNAQSLFLYLSLGPHTGSLPCAFVQGELALAEAINWPIKAFRSAFAELAAQRLAVADWKSRLVFLPTAIAKAPESPNVVKAWRSAFAELPDCALKDEIEIFLKDYGKGLQDGLRKAFSEAFGEALPKAKSEAASPTLPEERSVFRTDPETDTEKNQRKREPAAPADARRRPFSEFFHAEFQRLRGVRLQTDASDWKSLDTLLKKTVDDQAFSLEALKEMAGRFFTSDEDFHVQQGHPLRFFCSNINAFVGKNGNGTSSDRQALTNRLKEYMP